MKIPLFIAGTMLLIAVNCFSQSAEKNNYLQKSKNQKTVAWVLLGTGAVIDIIGIATYPGGVLLSPSEKQREKTAIWLIAAGSATMLASIPFFVSAHKNKKKALSVTINTQQFRQLNKSKLYAVNYPALTLKVRL